MPGPAPAVAATRRALRDWVAGAPYGGPLVLGLSGGADSLALAAALAFVAPRDGLTVRAVVVDHGLQDGSGDVAARAAAASSALGLPAEVVRVDVGDGPNLEARARDARRSALLDRADGGWVLLAHTLDDQAEAVLLGLGRGSGVAALSGMPPYADDGVGRPFLGVRRAQTEAACAAQDLTPWQDPHNDDPRFRRVRVRHEVLPLLEDVLGGGVAEALARTAGQLADLRAALVLPPYDDDLDAADLAAHPPAVRTAAVHAWLRGRGVTGVTAAHVGAVDRLVTAWHGQGPVAVPGGSVRRVHGRLVHDASGPR